jgi:hypothetical protein
MGLAISICLHDRQVVTVRRGALGITSPADAAPAIAAVTRRHLAVIAEAPHSAARTAASGRSAGNAETGQPDGGDVLPPAPARISRMTANGAPGAAPGLIRAGCQSRAWLATAPEYADD